MLLSRTLFVLGKKIRLWRENTTILFENWIDEQTGKMNNDYEFCLANPDFNNLGYLNVIANVQDKHDRSAPSNFHWKVLKCRMIIFSTSSILSCPDKSDVKKVHIIFNKMGSDYDRLTSLLLKFSLTQDGPIVKVTSDIYSMCFWYTMSAKLAPTWNVLGYHYFINNRDFLTATGSQDGIKCTTLVDVTRQIYWTSSCPVYLTRKNVLIDDKITFKLKPVKIHLLKEKDKFMTGDCVRVLPSLNKATIEEYLEDLPRGDFKLYKDLRRHWKNIHGYRLPEDEPKYYSVRFWRGEPLTYPDICLTTNFPNIIPMPRTAERSVLSRFIICLKTKMPTILGSPLNINTTYVVNNIDNTNMDIFLGTQAVSLCTPTQPQNK